jgi:hypothetical protein
MRLLTCLATILLSLTIFGCAHQPPTSPGQKAGTVLPPNDDIAALNARANDSNNSQEDRARAIFTLFAYHVHLGASATDIRRVFPNPAWVQQTHLYSGDLLTGWIPLDITPDESVFAIHLFPTGTDERWSPWIVYVRLTGRFLQYEDAVAFLRGERGSWNPKLAEFALCYPNSSEPRKFPGRIETFSREGVRVYEDR